MLVLHRAIRRVAVPIPTRFDPTLLATAVGLGGVGALASLEAALSRDGFAVIQRFGLPAAALVVWVTVFHWFPVRPSRSVAARPVWPAAGGLALATASAVFLAGHAQGQPWGVVALAIASYLALFGAAALRRDGGSWGLGLVVIVQLGAGAVAFTLVDGPVSAVVGAVGATVVLAALLALRRFVSPRHVRPLDELATIAVALREVIPLLLAAAVASVALSLMIGGQTTAMIRLLVPFVGVAATRLVAEEVLLRLWLLPSLERRVGAAIALLLTAAWSGAIAAVVRPASLSPFAAAAAALAAALAAGVLARRTGNGPAVVVFRLLAG
jgi:hypothetical protein